MLLLAKGEAADLKMHNLNSEVDDIVCCQYFVNMGKKFGVPTIFGQAPKAVGLRRIANFGHIIKHFIM